MIEHLLLDHAIFVANLAAAALLGMLLKLIIACDLLTTPSFVATIELHGLQETQQILIVNEGLHIRGRLSAVGASFVRGGPTVDA